MIEYHGMVVLVDRRIDGQYYCRIYNQGHPDPLFSTAYYPIEAEAFEEAKRIIRDHLGMTDEPQPS
jgi:hypothetical protein